MSIIYFRNSALENIEEDLLSVSADRAYDTNTAYQAIEENSNDGVVVAIPPRKNAVLSENHQHSPGARDHNILFAQEYGKYRWQDYSDYSYRSLVETAMFRYKTIIGDTMYSRTLPAQQVESRIACLVLNKMAEVGMPESNVFKRAA